MEINTGEEMTRTGRTETTTTGGITTRTEMVGRILGRSKEKRDVIGRQRGLGGPNGGPPYEKRENPPQNPAGDADAADRNNRDSGSNNKTSAIPHKSATPTSEAGNGLNRENAKGDDGKNYTWEEWLQWAANATNPSTDIVQDRDHMKEQKKEDRENEGQVASVAVLRSNEPKKVVSKKTTKDIQDELKKELRSFSAELNEADTNTSGVSPKRLQKGPKDEIQKKKRKDADDDSRTYRPEADSDLKQLSNFSVAELQHFLRRMTDAYKEYATLPEQDLENRPKKYEKNRYVDGSNKFSKQKAFIQGLIESKKQSIEDGGKESNNKGLTKHRRTNICQKKCTATILNPKYF